MTHATALDALVDARFDESVAFLRELVRMPSDTPPGDNAAHAEGTAKLLEALGFTVERHPIPADLVARRGMKSVTNLIVRHKFGPGPVIALNAHGDVVPPGEGWTKGPYEGVVDKGRMYGRGVAVSKSDFATYTFALDALRRAGHSHGTVELHFTYDEEMGGELGPGWLLAQGLSKPDYAIGAGFSYAVVTGHNGALHLEVTVRGEAAHAAMPETGVDALRASVDIIQALYSLRRGYATVRSAVEGIGSPTINVGLIEGGINTNVVPDKVRFSLDRRMIPEEDPETVEKALRETIFRAQAMHSKVRVDIRRILLARALKPRPGHEVLVKALQAEGQRVFGTAPPAVGVPLYTDARLYGEAGVPIVLFGAGPRTILEANAKRADENLVLDDLRKATKVVAGALATLLA
ncbi:ArgE/DapE family deacylase [Usitatibacter palustris]|uniref:Probable succinyl-diaminopimelate desuccinylase n=1 Tax=Usitatibacter palustris TaxID=2732487 RepID=A0A6M4H9N1_9PROT|nr:ArgE/DapE family deacylase [Usitatibacter palustris]QJR15895.1 Acetylornithine deacetylase [Usitatibacter palustris]